MKFYLSTLLTFSLNQNVSSFSSALNTINNKVFQQQQQQQQQQSVSNNINIISTNTKLNSSNDPDEEIPVLEDEATSASEPYVIPYEENSDDELIYTLGVNLARQLGDVRPLCEDNNELAIVAKGLLDAIIGRIEDDEQKILLKRRGTDLNELITERAKIIQKRIEESGRLILKEMSEQDDVIVLPSGVVVHPLESGPDGTDGVRPSLSSTVKVHYHGTLSDGTVFDSTLNKDPVTFALGQVIPGWREALQKMHDGETAMIGIPPEMGYGPDGTPDGRIPGGATLFFKVQLVQVLSAGIGGSVKLLGTDGKVLTKDDGKSGTSGLLGLDGKPLG